jgi:NADH-quinone oxidoreductase subunit F
MERLTSFAALEEYRGQLVAGRDPQRVMVAVCAGTGCIGCGANQVVAAFKKELAEQGLADKVEFRATGCHGFCERGTLVVIHPQRVFYQVVSAKDVPEIVEKTVKTGEVIDRLLYADKTDKDQKVLHEHDVPFYKHQRRLIFGNNGAIDPTSLDDYIALGGYAALAKALATMQSDQIIAEVKRAGLRGRGGGGFPAGVKWESCRNAKGSPKYVVCNADEGDPGAYMDRSLLEGNPHSVLEGMVIGAYAIGSNDGYIYVRNEYPLAVQNATIAIDQARAAGLLGKNILGTDFSYDIKISRGGGAFVCGESTALMASLEGQAGEPRAKYVHTVEHGLYNRPTNLNNVETWANVPYIVLHGADEYRKIGTEGSPGTKIFSLVGKVNNTGLIEVPMGITLRDIIYNIGGGIPKEKKFKAVQTGGPSGGCIPAEHLDLPVDFDKLYDVGSMMGSGGMIVMDENTCMVELARYFTAFLSDESCGKCLPCREGLTQMRGILQDICDGKGQDGDLDLIETLAGTIRECSLCALGQTAPNPVESTLRFFRSEYEAHIHHKRCPAGVCPPLITYKVLPDRCTACGACKRVCPAAAVEGQKKVVHRILVEKCIKCGQCYEICPADAIIKE